MSGPNRFIVSLATPVEATVRDLFAYTNPARFGDVSDEDLARHITQVRDKACEYGRRVACGVQLLTASTDKVAPWPCIGGFRFLVPGICQAEPVSAYSSIRKRLQDNPQAKVLDLGCCFGHDARQLLKDGVRADQIVACDLVPDLITLGFELFGDKRDQGHNRGMTWEKVDIFNKDDVERIKQPHGYDAIYVGSFLHLFPFEWQQKAMAAVNSLLSEEKGSVVWGRQIGVELGKAGAMERISKPYRGPTGIDANADGTQQSPFFHDEATLQKIFDGASHDGWEADVKTYEFSNERGFQKGEGEQMIAPGLADAMKRLAFAFSRK